MTVIAEGAEAVISREDGEIVKERRPKQYRHPGLDDRLRAERTQREARLLRKAGQAGVAVPTVESVEEYRLEMREVSGTMLKAVLPDQVAVCRSVGESIARLHNNGIIHGDLTTSNLIVAGNAVVFIDFGLGFSSERIEDKATDLHLLKQVFESTHTAVADEAMEYVLAGYRDAAADPNAVLQRLKQIAHRGRYR